MRKWKMRLEIWIDAENMTSWLMQILCGFLQGWILYQLQFVSAKYQYVYYSNIVMDTEWESQVIVLWKEHISCLWTI